MKNLIPYSLFEMAKYPANEDNKKILFNFFWYVSNEFDTKQFKRDLDEKINEKNEKVFTKSFFTNYVNVNFPTQTVINQLAEKIIKDEFLDYHFTMFNYEIDSSNYSNKLYHGKKIYAQFKVINGRMSIRIISSDDDFSPKFQSREEFVVSFVDLKDPEKIIKRITKKMLETI